MHHLHPTTTTTNKKYPPSWFSTIFAHRNNKEQSLIFHFFLRGLIVGMVGSKVVDHLTMNGDDDDDDGDSVAVKQQRVSASSSDVSCSICLDLVPDDGGRSRAKLHCGHEFHLDCIGSAFNMKGAMQCPNCRKVEKGRWLYANGSTRSVPEFTAEEWIPDEEPYDVAFPELPVRVHWCPFSGLTRLRSYFEEVESPSTTYHGLRGHHIFAEQTAASSISHSYAAYVGHVPSRPPNVTEIVEDPAYTPFHGVSVNNDLFGPNAFSPLDNRYQRRTHRSAQNGSHVHGADQASHSPATVRSNHGESPAIPRPGSSPHPFLRSHSRSGPRARNGILHHLPGGNLRIPGQPAFQPQQSSLSLGMWPPVVGIRRYSGTRSIPTASLPEHSGFYVFPPSSSAGPNLHEGENPLPTHVHGWSCFPASSASRESSWN